ncbi:MAG: TIM barrel protein, partial [Gemmatimonadota bacterium]
LGLATLGLIHCNDSLGTLGSRRDRHADIGAGELGAAPFRALMRDPRLREVPRVIETPKGGDPIAADRRNLQTLRRLARA